MKLILNAAQREALSWYFNPENSDGEPWPLHEPVKIDVVKCDGVNELRLNSTYLHSDGEWATYPERRREEHGP